MNKEPLYPVRVRVNGREAEKAVPARRLLVDFLREDLGLKGAHVGCDTSNCGACTVMVDGRTRKSCTMFAVQASGCEIITVESLAEGGRLHPLQQAFQEEHALQCGFCTPGMLMSALYLLQRNPSPSEEEIRTAIAGNLCRCTGYHNIVRAVARAAERLRSGPTGESGEEIAATRRVPK